LKAVSGMLQQLFDVAITLLFVAFLVQWTWAILHPLLPVLAVVLVVYGFVLWQRRR
jgi:hypothetical protein